MKKIWKYLIAAAVLATAAVTVAGCSQWDPVYKHMDEEGYTVSVRFDPNGGVFANKEGVNLVDVFNLSDYTPDASGKVQIKVLDPEDPARQKAGNYSASRTGYFLAGWYTDRQPRVNDKGEALDAYGELVSVSGREQGYIYSGRWDFENGRLAVDPNAEHSSFDEQMTLYAAWVPYFNFEFYAPDASGQMVKLDLGKSSELRRLTLPVWDETTGKINMGDVPARENMTFEAAYLDETMQTPATGTITGSFDPEHGIAVENTVKLYTTWREGTWFRIYNAKQFKDNSRLSGSYELYADLDFTGQVWSPTLASGVFTGTIVGNGHTIKNVTVAQADTSKQIGGLFGGLGAEAHMEDVAFENITYSLEAGSRLPDAAYGLLAGTVTEGATLTNVTMSGALKIGKDCIPRTDYNVGLLFGIGSVEGMSHVNITCSMADPDTTSVTFAVDEATGEVTLTFAE